MTDEVVVTVCQRCGRGFVLTDMYQGLLERWGRRIVVPVICPSCFLHSGPLPKEHGRVKWFDSRKRHGFIVAGQVDVFFHEQQLVGEVKVQPQTGQPARFHVRHSSKGPEAVNIEIER